MTHACDRTHNIILFAILLQLLAGGALCDSFMISMCLFLLRTAALSDGGFRTSVGQDAWLHPLQPTAYRAPRFCGVRSSAVASKTDGE